MTRRDNREKSTSGSDPAEMSRNEERQSAESDSVEPEVSGVRLGVTYSLLVLSSFLMAAHNLRWGGYIPAGTTLFLPAILLIRRRWALYVTQGLLLIGTLVWIKTAIDLILMRIHNGQPWFRLLVILAVVAGIGSVAAYLLSHRRFHAIYPGESSGALWTSTVFFLVTVTLSMVQANLATLKPLLAERFIWGGGWLELVLIGIYAVLVFEQLEKRRGPNRWRTKIWLLFSIVFFGQLVLGLLGFERLLMTGRLHVPVPAVIIAGPLFRGGGLFMPILFLVTIALVGPAWCSYLCYFGAWDGVAAKKQKKPVNTPTWMPRLRIALLIAVVAVALIARLAGLSASIAAGAAILFGLGGIVVMLIWSRRHGVMVHCVSYCPLGLVTVFLGQWHPFRVSILPSCTDCGVCSMICRYNALTEEHVRNRKTGMNCTLCGDCIGTCPHHSLSYSFFRHHSPRIRTIFLVLVVSIHAVFLALARL